MIEANIKYYKTTNGNSYGEFFLDQKYFQEIL